MIPRQERGQRFRPADRAAEDDPVPREARAQGLSVTIKDVQKFGYTPKCVRCNYIKAHGHTRGCFTAHSDECRIRVSEELDKSEEGRRRLRAVAARLSGESRTTSSRVKEEPEDVVPAVLPSRADGGTPALEPAGAPRTPSSVSPVGQAIGGEVDSDLESEERDDSGPLPGDEDMDDGKTAENESVDSDMSYLALLKQAGVPPPS